MMTNEQAVRRVGLGWFGLRRVASTGVQTDSRCLFVLPCAASVCPIYAPIMHTHTHRKSKRDSDRIEATII